MSSVSGSRVTRPAAGECSPLHERYVARVPESDIAQVLENQVEEWRRLAAGVTPEREDFRYAPGKWRVRDVFGHVADTERLFGYRLFSVLRGERASLPGADENAYAREAEPWLPRLDELVREFASLRESNLFLVRRFDETSSVREGVANGIRVTARALAYCMAGHVRHHTAGLVENYGLRG
jgi:DinB family protein